MLFQNTLERSIGVLALLFIFWPLGLAAVDATRWFFQLAPIIAWDGNRVAFLIAWPFLAFLAVAFLLCIFE